MTAVDALVFVRATAALESDVKAYSEPGKLGFTITPRNEVRAQFSIVDAGTGDVLYVFSAAGRGDNATTRTRLERGISSAIESLPH